MRKLFAILVFLCAWTVTATATDVTVTATTQPNFNPSGLPADVALTSISVTNGSPTVTCSACFRPQWVGLGGFTIAISGVNYTVSYVTSTSSLTLTGNYAGSTSAVATITWYKYVELRFYANAAFQPLGETYVVQPGTPGSAAWYKRIAVSVINVTGVWTAYIPEMVLDSTTDSPGPTNQARYVAGFYRPDGSLVSYYACFTNFAVPATTPTTWTALCAYNSPAAIVPPTNEAYTKPQIDARFPSCTADEMLYFAATGNTLACLNVGAGLTISGGTISSAASSNLRNAYNAVEDYGAVGDGVTNDTTALQNCIDASEASGGLPCYIKAGTYLHTGLTISDNGNIIGDGKTKTVLYSATNAPIIDVPTTAYDASIRSLGIKGLKAAGSSQVGIRLDGTSYYYGFLLEDIKIEETGSAGLLVVDPFSSSFRDIFIDDTAGFPLDYQAPVAPSNTFSNIYVGVVNATANVGFRIKSGDFICTECNGINSSPAGGAWAAVGKKNGVDGDTEDSGARFTCIHCNLESFSLYGILVYSYSKIHLLGNTTIAGAGAGVEKALHFDNAGDGATGCTPSPACDYYSQLIARGYIDDTVDFADGYAGYANSQPIHTAKGFPAIQTLGQGPSVAGGVKLSTYYNETTSTTEKLSRADGKVSVSAISSTTTIANPGVKYIEADSTGGAITITIPWGGWYQEAQEMLVIKDTGGAAATNNITLQVGSGANIGSSTSLVMNQNGQTVILMPSGSTGTGAWRILYDSASGGGGSAALTATYVGYGSGANVLTGEAAFNYNATTNTLDLDHTTITQSDTTIVPFTLQAAAASTAELAQIKDSGGTVRGGYATSGAFFFRGFTVAPTNALANDGKLFYDTTGGVLNQQLTLSKNTGQYNAIVVANQASFTSTRLVRWSNAASTAWEVDDISGATSDGTNVTFGSTNLRATSPRITTGIQDANGNELFLFTATGSAVNELTYANAATGGNPTFTASGNDANIGINFTAKAAAALSVRGNSTQAGEFRLYEDTDDGTNYVALKAGTLAGNVTWTLPTADSSGSQCLASNGSGVLSWTACSGGSAALTSTYVGYGDGSNVLTGENAFTYDASTNILSFVKWSGAGLDIDTDLDNTAALVEGSFSIIKNDGNLRTFHGIYVAPVLNTGGSNTQTTLNIISVDTTNTAVTGLTTNLLNLAYGGTTVFTVTSAGAMTLADGVKQTFNPNATTAGINVGSVAGDPSAPANGDLWYDSTANELTARINGATVALGAGGGLTVGTTAIASGAAGRILYETSGNVLGEIAGSSVDADGAVQFAASARTSGVAQYFRVNTPADTTLTASTQSVGIYFGGDGSGSTVTRQWATGALTTQRENVFVAPTYAFVGASTLTTAATVSITGAPTAGTNATITNALALNVEAGRVRFNEAGTAASPGIQFRVSNTGFWYSASFGSDSIGLTSGSAQVMVWNSSTGNTHIHGSYQLVWGSSGLATPDTGLARAAANVLRVTSTSTGAGKLIIGTSSASTSAADLYVVGSSASLIPFRVDSASSATAAIADFTNNGTSRVTINPDSSILLSGVAFASLGTPTDGTIAYCTDCNVATAPCTSGGTGAIAARLNGAWRCM